MGMGEDKGEQVLRDREAWRGEEGEGGLKGVEGGGKD